MYYYCNERARKLLFWKPEAGSPPTNGRCFLHNKSLKLIPEAFVRGAAPIRSEPGPEERQRVGVAPSGLTRFPLWFFFMLPALLRFFSTFTVTPLLSGRRDSGSSAAVEELKVDPGVAEPRPQLRRSWALCPRCGSTLRPAAPSCAAGLRCAVTGQEPLRESVSGYSSSPADSPLTRPLIGSLTAPPAGGHRASGDMLNHSVRRVGGRGR